MSLYDFYRYYHRESHVFGLKLCDISPDIPLRVPLYAEKEGRSADRILQPYECGTAYRVDDGTVIKERWIGCGKPNQVEGMARNLIREFQPMVERIQWLRAELSAFVVFSLPVSVDITAAEEDFVPSLSSAEIVPTGVQRFAIQLPLNESEEGPKAVRFYTSVSSNSRVVDIVRNTGIDYRDNFNSYF